MKPGRPCVLELLVFVLLFFPFAPNILAAEEDHPREVYLGGVYGDVRLSRGDGKRTKLNGAWEQAFEGESLQQGFALATGNGRAEIEFEDGSTAYLAENSLLLFTTLSAAGDSIKSRITLATGMATFSLQPATNETFFIVTPMETIEVSLPNTFFARVNAYLDATGITFQGGEVSEVSRKGLPRLAIASGRTTFFQGGDVLPDASPGAPPLSSGPVSDFAHLLPSPVISGKSADRVVNADPSSHDWDQWVAARVQEKKANLDAALIASGLPAPVPGLADLYAHGTFFDCAPYGTCWDPAQEEFPQTSAPYASSPAAQSPQPSVPNALFQPQTVEVTETIWGVSGTYVTRPISRVAHTQAELDALLRIKVKYQSAQNQNLLRANWGQQQSCYTRSWIPRGGGRASPESNANPSVRHGRFLFTSQEGLDLCRAILTTSRGKSRLI